MLRIAPSPKSKRGGRHARVGRKDCLKSKKACGWKMAMDKISTFTLPSSAAPDTSSATSCAASFTCPLISVAVVWQFSFLDTRSAPAPRQHGSQRADHYRPSRPKSFPASFAPDAVGVSCLAPSASLAPSTPSRSAPKPRPHGPHHPGTILTALPTPHTSEPVPSWRVPQPPFHCFLTFVA